MVEHRPTEDEFKKMFDTKMNLVVTVDGITYDNIRFLSDQTGRSMDDLVKRAVEKEKARRIQLIKESVFEYIKEHNGKCDMVDVALQFPEYTCDIPLLAINELVEDGRVESKVKCGNQYVYFVRE